MWILILGTSQIRWPSFGHKTLNVDFDSRVILKDILQPDTSVKSWELLGTRYFEKRPKTSEISISVLKLSQNVIAFFKITQKVTEILEYSLQPLKANKYSFQMSQIKCQKGKLYGITIFKVAQNVTKVKISSLWHLKDKIP